jgi:hypothetical protein
MYITMTKTCDIRELSNIYLKEKEFLSKDFDIKQTFFSINENSIPRFEKLNDTLTNRAKTKYGVISPGKLYYVGNPRKGSAIVRFNKPFADELQFLKDIKLQEEEEARQVQIEDAERAGIQYDDNYLFDMFGIDIQEDNELGLVRKDLKYKPLNVNTSIKDKDKLLSKHGIKKVKSHYYYVLSEEQQRAADKWLQSASRNKNEEKRRLGSTIKGFDLVGGEKQLGNWQNGNITLRIENGRQYLYLEDTDKILDEQDGIKYYRYPITGSYRIPIEIVGYKEEKEYLNAEKNQTLYIPFLQKEINKILVKTKNISAKKSGNYFLLMFKNHLRKIALELAEKEYSFEDLKNLSKEDAIKIYEEINIEYELEKVKEKYKKYIDSLSKEEVINEILDVFRDHLTQKDTNNKNPFLPFDSNRDIKDFEKLLRSFPDNFVKMVTMTYVEEETAFFSSGNELNVKKPKIVPLSALKSMEIGMAINVALRNMKDDGLITDQHIKNINKRLTPQIKKYLEAKKINPGALQSSFVRKISSILIELELDESIERNYFTVFNDYWKKAQAEIRKESIKQNQGLTWLAWKAYEETKQLNNVFSRIEVGNINAKYLPFNYDKLTVIMHELGHAFDKYLFVTNPLEREKIIDFIDGLIVTPEFQTYIKEGLESRNYDVSNTKEMTADLYAYILGKAIGRDFTGSHLESMQQFFTDNMDKVNEIFEDVFGKYKKIQATNFVTQVQDSFINKIRELFNKFLKAMNDFIGTNYFKYLKLDEVDIEFESNNKINVGDIFETIKDIVTDDSNFDIDNIMNSSLTSDDFNEYGIINDAAVIQPIKQGVEELFNENPELANQVYEALGFKQIVSQDNKSYYRGQLEPFKLDADGNLILEPQYAGWQEEISYDKYKGKGVSLSPNLSVSTAQANMFYEGKLSRPEDEGWMDMSESDDWVENITNEGYYVVQIDKKYIQDSFKDIFDNENYEQRIGTEKNIIIPNGKFKIENIKPDLIEGEDYQSITSQQKQQALQLYSQYLDTIFPDTKVKQIVYHGSPEYFEIFDKSKLGKYTKAASAKEGFFFGSSEEVSRDYLDKKGKTLNVDSLIKSKYGGVEQLKNKAISYEGVIRIGKPSDQYSYFETFAVLHNGAVIGYGESGNIYSKGDINSEDFISLIKASEEGSLKEIQKSIQSEYKKEGDLYENYILRKNELSDVYDQDYGGYIDKNRNITDKPFEDLFLRRVILSISNPLITSDQGKKYREETYFSRIVKAKNNNKDGVIIEDTFDSKLQTKPENVYVVFEPEQIHILGSNQDIKGFKEFIDSGMTQVSESKMNFEPIFPDNYGSEIKSCKL